MKETKKDEKICCLLFHCPMIEEFGKCNISNLRIVNFNQPFYVEEKVEYLLTNKLLYPKFLCLISKNE